MRKNVDLETMTDGKLYKSNDMVKLLCNDCIGCVGCCNGMGSSIQLDPYDIFLLTGNLKCNFQDLLAEKIELSLCDGLILPNLRMNGEREVCTFLNANGRCSIHAFRPVLCRLFPLGRLYREDELFYIHQINECGMQNGGKIKIAKWLGLQGLKEYESYIIRWHKLIARLQKEYIGTLLEGELKSFVMEFLGLFFVETYDFDSSFYMQFEQRESRLYDIMERKENKT